MSFCTFYRVSFCVIFFVSVCHVVTLLPETIAFKRVGVFAHPHHSLLDNLLSFVFNIFSYLNNNNIFNWKLTPIGRSTQFGWISTTNITLSISLLTTHKSLTFSCLLHKSKSGHFKIVFYNGLVFNPLRQSTLQSHKNVFL